MSGGEEWTLERLIAHADRSCQRVARLIETATGRIPASVERDAERHLATAAALRRLEALEGFVARMAYAGWSVPEAELADFLDDELDVLEKDPHIARILQAGRDSVLPPEPGAAVLGGFADEAANPQPEEARDGE